MLGDSFRVEVVSFAVGGSRASDLVRTQLPPAAALRPDVALVSVGGNDALRGVPLASFRSHLDTIAATLAATAGLVVLSGVGDLGSIPRLAPPLDRLYRRRGQQLNGIHHEVAQRHGVVVADQWAWAAQEFQRRPDLFSPDLFHPTAEGHRLWAQVAVETLEPHLHQFARG
jgi:lysophospholipase L1-like esterase